MSHVFQPLSSLLQDHLNINAARLHCLELLLQALVAARTVNLAVLASHMVGRAEIASHYRRLQRFMREIRFAPAALARLLLALFDVAEGDKLLLILDRTNWKFGKIHINILYLAVAHGSMAIPLFGYF